VRCCCSRALTPRRYGVRAAPRQERGPRGRVGCPGQLTLSGSAVRVSCPGSAPVASLETGHALPSRMDALLACRVRSLPGRMHALRACRAAPRWWEAAQGCSVVWTPSRACSQAPASMHHSRPSPQRSEAHCRRSRSRTLALPRCRRRRACGAQARAWSWLRWRPRWRRTRAWPRRPRAPGRRRATAVRPASLTCCCKNISWQHVSAGALHQVRSGPRTGRGRVAARPMQNFSLRFELPKKNTISDPEPACRGRSQKNAHFKPDWMLRPPQLL